MKHYTTFSYCHAFREKSLLHWLILKLTYTINILILSNNFRKNRLPELHIKSDSIVVNLKVIVMWQNIFIKI